MKINYIILCLLTLVLCVGCQDELGNPPAIVSITFNSSTVKIDTDVIFTATTEGDVDTYEWDFGDGSEPIEKTEPTCTYNFSAVGTFIVKLTIKGKGGESTEELEVEVKYPNKAIVKSVTVISFPALNPLTNSPWIAAQPNHANIFFVFYKSGTPWEAYTTPIIKDVTSFVENPYTIDLSNLSVPNELNREETALKFGVGHTNNEVPVSGNTHFVFTSFNVGDFLSGPNNEVELTYIFAGANIKIVIQKVDN
jgi:PKD repeat protein